MTAMLIGTTLALIALAFVLYPLFRDVPEAAPVRARTTEHSRSASAVDALREIEFDHATGKLSDQDYGELTAVYTNRAVAAMRGEEDRASVICGVCGPRPEPDAVFCSSCGRSLAA